MAVSMDKKVRSLEVHGCIQKCLGCAQWNVVIKQIDFMKFSKCISETFQKKLSVN